METVRKFAKIRQQLQREETQEFQPMGQSFRVGLSAPGGENRYYTNPAVETATTQTRRLKPLLHKPGG